jgi:hypothetical protein
MNRHLKSRDIKHGMLREGLVRVMKGVMEDG